MSVHSLCEEHNIKLWPVRQAVACFICGNCRMNFDVELCTGISNQNLVARFHLDWFSYDR